ncbi:class I SAM-dependent methyltransferase [Dyella sp.]|jgi:SAM-dependent methyltransferase|uniref:class I SAM-dependent methyltransferase n=1 Tax=Dyella sp. TaxID=1869338 RepID=UPI002D77ADBE|nr:class I SAM-dependent methyltransferase [Dyella sp.]HET6433199.1 class I SAM-dependent methyltransferase [Dyella sp.]
MASASAEASAACPLCGAASGTPWRETTGVYRGCAQCDLVSRDRSTWLDADAERAYYGTHDNRIDDPGYRRFLSQLADPLIARLSPGARGLDYGCGAAPALALMLTDAGFPTVGYDPFFAPDESRLAAHYDFVTCTEVLEHMHDPLRDLACIDAMLRPGGWLGLMTELRPPLADFPRWHYHRDPTHVGFHSERSLGWIAGRFGWSVESLGRRVALVRKGTMAPRQAPNGTSGPEMAAGLAAVTGPIVEERHDDAG